MAAKHGKIAIMGCGWLGLPLAKALLETGFHINGSTTSDEKIELLQENGILPYLISLSEDDIQGDIESFLSGAAILIINVPPRLRGEHRENYVKKMHVLHKAIGASAVQKIIFVSSTSVYGDFDGEVFETTEPHPVTESGKQLLVSENIFRNHDALKATIIRFAGLIGPDRHPVTMLSGRKNLSNGNYPINLIHLNDCIKIICEIVKNDWWGELFNAVYPYHPTKKEYYTSKAIEKKIQPPLYSTNNTNSGKIITSYTLTNIKGFKYTTTL